MPNFSSKTVAALAVLLDKVYGETVMRVEDLDNIKFAPKDTSWNDIARYNSRTGEVWIKLNDLPKKSKEEIEKVLTTGRFENIIFDSTGER